MQTTLIIGPVFCDFLLDGFRRIPKPGEELFLDNIHLSLGGAAITATALARLGIQTQILSFLGEDLQGQYLKDELSSNKIDITSLYTVPDQSTAMTLIFPYDNNRGFITRTMPDSDFASYTAEKLERMELDDVKNIHMTFSLLKEPRINRIIKKAEQKGISISLDLGFEEAQSWTEEDFELIKGIDFFMPNETEARMITGMDDLEASLRRMKISVGCPLITLGEKGAVFLDEEERFRSVLPVEINPVNTTGAGDSFTAGFLYGRSIGCTLSESVKRGTITGSLTAGSKNSVSPEISVSTIENLAG